MIQLGEALVPRCKLPFLHRGIKRFLARCCFYWTRETNLDTAEICTSSIRLVCKLLKDSHTTICLSTRMKLFPFLWLLDLACDFPTFWWFVWMNTWSINNCIICLRTLRITCSDCLFCSQHWRLSWCFEDLVRIPSECRDFNNSCIL